MSSPIQYLKMCPLDYDPRKDMIDSIKDPNIPLHKQSKHVQAYELVWNEKNVPLSQRYRIRVQCSDEFFKICWVRSHMLGQWLKQNVRGFTIYGSMEELELKHKMEAEESSWVRRNIKFYENKGVLNLGLIDSISLLFLCAVDYFTRQN